MLKSDNRSRKVRPEFMVAALLLLFPAGAAAFLFYPSYYWFSGTGDIVSVQDIGVDGSVHFTYVNEGIASNRFEKLMIQTELQDVEFEPADANEDEELDAYMEVAEDARNVTIEHAVTSVAEENATDIELEERREQLIDETADYYGDSIGLMLAIGLAEEGKQVDYSRNGRYLIAGTGTLEADSVVGSVGAIRNKLRTAENDKVDIFFVPKDKDTFIYEGLSNEAEAEVVKQELNLTLRIVPVQTLDEALQFLEQLN